MVRQTHHDETGNTLSLPVLSLSKDAPPVVPELTIISVQPLLQVHHEMIGRDPVSRQSGFFCGGSALP
jgi:hypothetical protein